MQLHVDPNTFQESDVLYLYLTENSKCNILNLCHKPFDFSY